MTASALPGPVVLYDGTCGLCHRSVRWLMKRDGRRLWYAPLQGETAAALRGRFAIPDNLSSVVFIDGDRMFLRSKAFLYAAKYLTRPWRWMYAVRWFPAILADLGYRVVAALRYRLFGKYDSCRLPTADERAQQLP